VQDEATVSNRVNRGGSWNNTGTNLRSANRNNNIGFRVGFRVGFSGMDFS